MMNDVSSALQYAMSIPSSAYRVGITATIGRIKRARSDMLSGFGSLLVMKVYDKQNADA